MAPRSSPGVEAGPLLGGGPVSRCVVTLRISEFEVSLTSLLDRDAQRTAFGRDTPAAEVDQPGRHSSPVHQVAPKADIERKQLSLLRAIRLVRSLDHRLEEIEPDVDLAKRLAEGWITPDEFRSALELPDSTGALAVLRDGLGLFPALADGDLEIVDEWSNENDWTSVTIEHCPTRIRCRGRAPDAAVAREIARCFLARLVWSEVIAGLERVLDKSKRGTRGLDRVIVGESSCESLRARTDSHRSSEDPAGAVAAELGVERRIAEMILEGATTIEHVMAGHREQLLTELGVAVDERDPRLICPSCGFDVAAYQSTWPSESHGPIACPGNEVVFEQTISWQGTEPLDCPVPVHAHAYRCGSTIQLHQALPGSDPGAV